MRVGIPRETAAGEARAALLPNQVATLVAGGHDVLVERRVGSLLEAPSLDEVPLFREGQTLMAFLDLPSRPELRSALAGAGVAAVALEAVEGPAGDLPLLSSQSAIAGRLAVMMGAYHLLGHVGGPGLFAGGLPGAASAKVADLGVGVAGSGAVRAAVGMGARVVAVEADPGRVAALDGAFAGHVDLLLVSEEAVRAAITGGCFETTRPGVLGDTPYVEEGVRHLCVPNLACAAASTATSLLSQRLLPYVAEVAEGGIMKASARDPGLARALTPG